MPAELPLSPTFSPPGTPMLSPRIRTDSNSDAQSRRRPSSNSMQTQYNAHRRMRVVDSVEAGSSSSSNLPSILYAPKPPTSSDEAYLLEEDAARGRDTFIIDSGISFDTDNGEDKYLERALRSRTRTGISLATRANDHSMVRGRKPSSCPSPLPPPPAYSLPLPPSIPPLSLSPPRTPAFPTSPGRAPDYFREGGLPSPPQLDIHTGQPLSTDTDLQTVCTEHRREAERLGKDLLAMTHRYLQARSEVERLEGRCQEMATKLDRMRLNDGPRQTNVNARPRTADCITKLTKRNDGSNEEWTAETRTLSNSILGSPKYTPAPSIQPEPPKPTPTPIPLPLWTPVSPDELCKRIKSINLQTLEIARTCIASTTFRAGARHPAVSTQDVRAVSDVLGTVFVQLLRSGDHTQCSSRAELGIQSILACYVYRIVNEWPDKLCAPSPAASVTSKGAGDDGDDFGPNKDAAIHIPLVEKAIGDIATVLSLCGSSGSISEIRRKHLARSGSTVEVVFKSAERIAFDTNGHGSPKVNLQSPRSDVFSMDEINLQPDQQYTLLFARSGSTFEKDCMHRHSGSAQGTMSKWMLGASGSKRLAQSRILCTKEIGLASRTVGKAKRDILVKSVVVLECDLEQ